MHVAGFAAAGLGGAVALVATAIAAKGVSTRLARASALVAVGSAAALALPGALGWYAFLAGFFGWTAMLSLPERSR